MRRSGKSSAPVVGLGTYSTFVRLRALSTDVVATSVDRHDGFRLPRVYESAAGIARYERSQSSGLRSNRATKIWLRRSRRAGRSTRPQR